MPHFIISISFVALFICTNSIAAENQSKTQAFNILSPETNETNAIQNKETPSSKEQFVNSLEIWRNTPKTTAAIEPSEIKTQLGKSVTTGDKNTATIAKNTTRMKKGIDFSLNKPRILNEKKDAKPQVATTKNKHKIAASSPSHQLDKTQLFEHRSLIENQAVPAIID